jgi:hypothetical protein
MVAMHLPPNVSAQRVPVSNTSFFYVLRHSELGVLGKIVLEQLPEGGWKIVPELMARAGSALSEMRRAVFEQIVNSLMAGPEAAGLPAP